MGAGKGKAEKRERGRLRRGKGGKPFLLTINFLESLALSPAVNVVLALAKPFHVGYVENLKACICLAQGWN
jgi:hypothetical protein